MLYYYRIFFFHIEYSLLQKSSALFWISLSRTLLLNFQI